MQPHILRTIEDIELKIGFLQRLAEALRGFDAAAPLASFPKTLVLPVANGHTPPQVKKRVEGRSWKNRLCADAVQRGRAARS